MAIGLNPTSNKAQVSVVELVALIVIIVIVGWFFVKPKMAELSDQKTQLQTAQSNYNNVQQDKQSLSDLIGTLNKSQSDITLLDEALPLQDRPTQVQLLLDSLATASGMQTVELGFDPVTDVISGNKALLKNEYSVDRALKATTFNMTVTGNIDQFRDFLQLVQSNGRILDVSTIAMENNQGVLSFKLKLKAYSYVP